MIHVFLNEFSLEGQYPSVEDFEKSLRDVSAALEMLVTPNVMRSVQMKYTKSLYAHNSGPTTPFAQHFARLRDKSVRELFLQLLNRLAAMEWRDNPAQLPAAVYRWGTDDVTDTTLAEGAEQKLQNANDSHLLISFAQSRFSDLHNVIVIRHPDSLAYLLNCHGESSLWDHLASILSIDRLRYPDDATRPPRDWQTVLRDQTRFLRTDRPRVQGRRVYEESSTGFLWYVDNMHFGRGAQIEVFKHNGTYHVGVASVAGTIDETKRDPARHMPI